jgi:hypothetical protein
MTVEVCADVIKEFCRYLDKKRKIEKKLKVLGSISGELLATFIFIFPLA